MKTANKNCGKHVDNLEPFEGSNLFSVNLNGVYVVYSYGGHFPLYIHKNGKWYGNNTKYSVTTGKHRSHAMPSCDDITWLDTRGMRDLL